MRLGGAEITPVEPDLVRTGEGMSEMTISDALAERGTIPRVLSIAGTDPSGGAGTAADTKSIIAAGGYAMAVVTSLVAQNTEGVRAIHTPPTDFLVQQLAAVSDDVRIDAVKTGMLGTAEIVDAVATFLDEHRPLVVVVDPVMVATSGDRLLAPDAEAAMREFCRRATVITPNIPELAVLCQSEPATTPEQAVEQARRWAAETGAAVVVKTGHLNSQRVDNMWVTTEGAMHVAPAARVETTNTHGTGCSLSSALATRLGAGDTPGDALAWVTDWLHEAIQYGSALNVGKGHGPVDHSHRARRLAEDASAVAWFAPIDPLESPQGWLYRLSLHRTRWLLQPGHGRRPCGKQVGTSRVALRTRILLPFSSTAPCRSRPSSSTWGKMLSTSPTIHELWHPWRLVLSTRRSQCGGRSPLRRVLWRRQNCTALG
ncbi:phosphomethylpyrimidine kinase [Cutibacterium acnes JCM 18918]|nr:phosphomethylpyrimidine kinase [Cutibacterium acnes JCM 18918]